jgi:hypothetical protein
MLSLGVKGYERMLVEQQRNRKLLEEKLRNLAQKLNERILEIFNPVAVAMSLNNLKREHLTALGGALYNLRVTGPRVYNPREKVFGTCCEVYNQPYIVMNAAIGAQSKDILLAIERLEKAYTQIRKK